MIRNALHLYQKVAISKMSPISRQSLQKIPLSYASCSIGCRPEDTLARRLEAISNAGFISIELSFPDILEFGSQVLGYPVQPDSYSVLKGIAQDVRRLCDANALTVMILQPFANFEGWPRGSKERDEAFTRAKAWIEIMKIVGTDLLQVGATDTPKEKISTARDTIVSDLRELGGMLAENNLRLAYENWCWSTHAPGWKEVWEIVRDVDLPNVGLCLDTFQSCGSEWGDPTTPSGMIESVSPEQLQRNWHSSMQELAATVPEDKIYLLQISDAYKVSPPLENKVIGGLRPRGRWSHDFRPMPYDGGYLPIEDFARAVLQTGFRGWFSMEIFDGGPDGKGREYEVNDFAKQAMKNMQKLLDNCATE